MYDVIIIGGGPAGLSSAIYSSRSGLKTLLLEGNVTGGELVNIKTIENYPGFDGQGITLAENMKKQALSFGTEIVTQNAENVTKKDDGFSVMTQTAFYKAQAIIITTGVKRKSNPIYDAMYGKGVSYCATCDGFFYKGETVAVIGGGNTAAEDAIYLSSLCREVYLFNLKPELLCEPNLKETLSALKNVKIFNSTVVKAVEGSDAVTGVRVFDMNASAESSIPVTGVFVAMGHVADKPLIKDLLVNDKGEIVVSDGVKTSVEGVFAAGDVTDSELKQVVTATAQGALAATQAFNFLSSKRK